MAPLTLIDSSHIGSCPECGAALMPENRAVHSEWHRGVRDWVTAVALNAQQALRRLDAEEERRREAVERE